VLGFPDLLHELIA